MPIHEAIDKWRAGIDAHIADVIISSLERCCWFWETIHLEWVVAVGSDIAAVEGWGLIEWIL